MQILKQSTAVDVIIGPFVDNTDGDTEETALTISAADVKLSKNGQTMAGKSDVTACAHDANGMYNCELDSTDTNTVGTLVIFVHESGALAVRHEFQVVEEAVYDALFASGAAGPLQSTTAGRTLDVTATGTAGIDWGNVENQGSAVNLSATTTNLCNTITTYTGNTVQTGDSFTRIGANGASLSAIPWNASWDAEVQSEVTDALTAYSAVATTDLPTNFGDLAITVTTGQVTVGTNNDKTGYSISGTKTTLDALNDVSTTDVADAVWDEALGGHQSVGTTGRALTLSAVILSETTLTGTPTTTVFRLTTGSATDDFYNDMEIVFISGNAAGLSRIITDYDGTSKDVTIDEALPVTPSASDAVIVRTTHKHSKSQIADAIWDEDIVAAHTTVSSAGLILANTRNLATGAGGISTVATTANVTTGTETLTYTATQELDGITHDIAPSVGNTEFYYEFDVGVTGVATEIIWHGHAESNGDSYTIKAYDWVSASYKTIGTIAASNSTTVITETFIVTSTMTGTGANAGKIRWQVTSADGTNFSTDFIVTEYTALPEAGTILHSGIAQAGSTNTITLDAGASATDDFYNHTRVIISSGTANEQERLIVDYDGTTKVATVAPPWIATPDNTSAFEVEPGLSHAETGWGTIKVGLAAAATSTSITLDSLASAVDDYYNGDLLHIDAGTGEGQTRYITDYNGTTKVATIDPAWTVTPDTTSEYIVEEGHPYLTSDMGAMQADLTSIKQVTDLGIRGAAIAGTLSTTEMTTDLTETTNAHYVGRLITFTTGVLTGQQSDITAYDGTTKKLTFTALTDAPSAGDDFILS